MSDYDFITDRLAVGNLASRAVAGFAAVVSVVTIEGRHRGRPWSAELTAPQVPGGVPVFVADIADGESSSDKTAFSCTHEDDRDLDYYLDDATTFIADHIRRGCVLVHCGAGRSRSVSVVVAYLCRYAGMSYGEALSFVKERREGAAPADCFKAAIERWLNLGSLTSNGPRIGRDNA